MPPPRQYTYDRRPVYGIIDPRCWYTADAAVEASGIAEKRLAEGRQAGILHPENDGTRDWYWGKELIRFVLWKSRKHTKRKKARAA